ncbi:MAG: hypothetical protein EBY85_03355 [Burkholderiaceae bacterium]|nr:hypothetical protein [Burkholderiaceae bacterium]
MKVHASDPTLQTLRHYGPNRVMVKLSGAYRQSGVDAEDLAQALLGDLGASALLWGSDWPHTGYEASQNYSQQLSELMKLVNDQNLSQQILSKNPQNLYWSKIQ